MDAHIRLGIDPQDRFFDRSSFIYSQGINKTGDLAVHIGGAIGIVLIQYEISDPAPSQDNSNNPTDPTAANDHHPGMANPFLFCRGKNTVITLEQLLV
jgi:hypothetical protein